MSLFGSLMTGFDDDTFFGGHRSIMRQMDQMMSSMLRDPFEEDPFFPGGRRAVGGGAAGGGAAVAFPALTAAAAIAPPPPPPPPPAQRSAVVARAHHRPRPAPPAARDPFSALAIPSVANIMSSIVQPQPDQMAQQGNCHMYSSSSVMTMTTGPDGRPQVYQATASSRGVPGGVRETRRTVSDSRTGTRKMAIGHHIGERSHIIEREHQGRGMEERQEFINLEEEEAKVFDDEFRRCTQQDIGVGALDYRPRHRTSTSGSYNPRASNLPAITSSSSEDRARRRDREERGHRSQRRSEPHM